MVHVYSTPVEELIDTAVTAGEPGPEEDVVIHEADVVIVGSGYGASVAALKLAGITGAQNDSIRVTVLERGREYAVGEFPNTLGELPGHIRFRRPADLHPSGNPDALFDLRVGDDADVLLGNGLGGGSLINASAAIEPHDEVFDHRWPAAYRDGKLAGAFAEIRKYLGVGDATPTLPKFTAFSTLISRVGGTSADKAPIAVTQGSAAPNHVGITQPACTNCGNCVTGCNVGAKNTLMMNLIPLAAERGAAFYTGANVLTVEPLPGGPDPLRWRLRVQRTRSIGTPLEDEHFFVHARYVILAAGALGSTEILQRSQAGPDGIALSDALGQGFSTNGDGLGFSYGQEAPVHGIGTGDIHGGNGPGPTITAIHRALWQRKDGQPERVTLEDGAVPASLVKLFGEVTTTGAALGRIGSNELPKWFSDAPQADHDPLAYDPDLLAHGQTLLMMSDDRALRRLNLAPLPADSDIDDPRSRLMRRHTVVGALSGATKDEADAGLRSIDRKLAGESLEPGFDGGQYVANPLWRLLPEAASEVLGGTLPGGRAISVHPLGGCRMGEHPTQAVVGPDCRVFRPDGAYHEGLYVMDGAVIPGALATNPFLTISAVAWTACDALTAGPLKADGWLNPSPVQKTTARPGLFRHHPGDPEPDPHRLILREQMLGRLTGGKGKQDKVADMVPDHGRRLFGRDGAILRFELEPADLHGGFVASGEHSRKVQARVTLYAHPWPAESVEKSRPYGSPPLLAEHVVARGTGTVTLLELDTSGSRTWRTILALVAYLNRRVVGSSGGGSWWDAVQGVWQVGRMHANYRLFRYDVKLTTKAGDTAITFDATKKIRWRAGAPRVWDSLLNLDVDKVRISRGDDEVEVPARFRVDAGYMLDEGLIQVEAGRADMIETVMSTLSFAGWFVRCLLQSSFWEFGSPSYPDDDPQPDLDPPPLGLGWGRKVDPAIYPLEVVDDNLGAIELQLVRYRNEGREPVLLVHGLAQGSGIYNSRHLSRSMARHLYKKGEYDVWLLDYRLSNRLQIPFEKYAIEAMGRWDIPAAVLRVNELSGGQPVKVFAHCVGAIATQMAILRGHLKDTTGANLVESVCFNAIHPWVVPSAANLVRLKVGSFARNWISDDLLDPILRKADQHQALRSLLDRIAFSLARISESDEKHGKEDELDNGICDRMTFFYGRMWRHGNLAHAVHDHWHELVGAAPAEVYQQLYFLIERERLLDDQGENTYLKDLALTEHWGDIPTFFIHGDHSDVFNPQSATRSAVRLHRIFRDHEQIHGDKLAPVRLRRYPGYGHMDPILAKKAYKKVYPDIVRFFRSAHAWHADKDLTVPDFDRFGPADDPELAARVKPECGPALRSAWIDGTDTVRVRYWAEQYRFNTSEVIGALYFASDQQPPTLATGPFRPEGCDDWFQWFDFTIEPDTVPRRGLYLPDFRLPGHQGDLQTALMVAPADWDDGKIIKLGQENLQVFQMASSDVPPSGTDDLPDTDLPDAPPLPAGTSAPAVGPASPAWYRRLVQRAQRAAGADERMRFLLGSCRYPGTPMERDNADAVFGAMLDRMTQADHDVAFMIGDQIYADAYADVFDADTWRERYNRSYIAAFNCHNLSRLLMALPVHFALDDHEFVDNYSGQSAETGTTPPRRNRGPQEVSYASFGSDQMRYAIRAARSYTSSAREAEPVGTAKQPPKGAGWYALDHDHEVNFPCFVLDTRSERELREAHRHHAAAQYPNMMADTQLAELVHWLSAAPKDQPKFLFAGQIVAPLTQALVDAPSLFRSEDGFFGYPGTLRAIVQHIAANQIPNVVFVGGDLHFSCAARLELSHQNGPPVTAWQIVASGLYAPMVFANGRPQEYVWLRDYPDWIEPELRYEPVDTTLRYQAEWLTGDPAHFVEIEVAADSGAGWVVTMRAFDRCAQEISAGVPFDHKADQVRLRFGP